MNKVFKIAVLKGDGIGSEVVDQALEVINKISIKNNITFETKEGLIGGVAIDTCNTPLPQNTIDLCKQSDAVLLGAVGGYKWDNLAGDLRPEAGLLGIRSELGLYANLRPATIYPALVEASPLKPELTKNGLDILVVRELTGGIYFGKRGRYNENNEIGAFDTEAYTQSEIRRIAITAFEAAKIRNKKVTSVDKANILESSRLWREVINEVAKEYPEITTEHMYVDNAAMQLVRNPSQFDVIVTSNIFGDILSDEAAMITGSIGMLPSASLGSNVGLYEPVHGSAPDIAGQNKANPIATIISVAMMMKYSFGLDQIQKDIENAVISVLNKGYRTGDIASEGTTIIGTKEMGKLIVAEL